MSNITLDAQPRVNGALLEKSVGKEVIIVGLVQSTAGNVMELLASVRPSPPPFFFASRPLYSSPFRFPTLPPSSPVYLFILFCFFAPSPPTPFYSPRARHLHYPNRRALQDKAPVRVVLPTGLPLPGCKFVEVCGKVQANKSIVSVRCLLP